MNTRLRIIDLNELEEMKKEFILLETALSFVIGKHSDTTKTKEILGGVYDEGCKDWFEIKSNERKQDYINKIIL